MEKRWGPTVLWVLDRFAKFNKKSPEALRRNASGDFFNSSQIVVCKVLLQQRCQLFHRIYLSLCFCLLGHQIDVRRTARFRANLPHRGPVQLALLFPELQQCVQYVPDTSVDANCLLLDLLRTVCFRQVDTGVGCPGILMGHIPKGIFDNHQCIAADAQFQKEKMLSLVAA